MRKIQFTNGEYYHIYNRGTDKRSVFLGKNDYLRFTTSMILLNDENNGLMILWRDFLKKNSNALLSDFLKPSFRKSFRKINPVVEIIAYCLNPNHYHFILKQFSKRGVEEFMHKIGTSYTKYFNQKNNRSGVLFQGKFKAVHINSNEYLLHLAAYVSCNSEIHGIALAKDYHWCSFPEYIKEEGSDIICSKEIILNQFKDQEDFKEFAERSIQDMRQRRKLEGLLLE